MRAADHMLHVLLLFGVHLLSEQQREKKECFSDKPQQMSDFVFYGN